MFRKTVVFSGLLLCGFFAMSQEMSKEQFRGLIDSMITADSLAQSQVQVQPNLRKGVRDDVVKFAGTHIGLRYRSGGTTQRGFDCSGFTAFVFARHGIRLPHTSAGQSLYGVDVPVNKLMKGDLVFFKGANLRRKSIGHVGIVVSEKGEPVRFVHSSTSEGVRIDQLSGRYYRLRYVKAKRILFD